MAAFAEKKPKGLKIRVEDGMLRDVKLAQGGDKDAFARLYATVYKDLYHIALYSLRNSHDAQDAVSDTVVDAFSSIHKLKEPLAFRGWIMKILSAKIKRKYREYANSTAPLDYEPEGESINYESIELMAEFSELSETERLLVSLSAISGYTSDEISSMTGINSNTVRSKVMRARNKLKSKLITETE